MNYLAKRMPGTRIFLLAALAGSILVLQGCAAHRTGIADYEASLSGIRHDVATPAGLESIRAQVFEITKDLSRIAACASRYLMSADRWLEQKAGRPEITAMTWPEADRARAALAWNQTRAALFDALDIHPQQAYGTTRDSK